MKKLQNNLQLVMRMKKVSLENSKRLQIDNINRWFFKLK